MARERTSPLDSEANAGYIAVENQAPHAIESPSAGPSTHLSGKKKAPGVSGKASPGPEASTGKKGYGKPI